MSASLFSQDRRIRFDCNFKVSMRRQQSALLCFSDVTTYPAGDLVIRSFDVWNSEGLIIACFKREPVTRRLINRRRNNNNNVGRNNPIYSRTTVQMIHVYISVSNTNVFFFWGGTPRRRVKRSGTFFGGRCRMSLWCFDAPVNRRRLSFFYDFRFNWRNLKKNVANNQKKKEEDATCILRSATEGWRKARVTCPVVSSREILNDGTRCARKHTAVLLRLGKSKKKKKRKPSSLTEKAIILKTRNRNGYI